MNIQLDSDFVEGYIWRRLDYYYPAEYQNAIQDYTKAIPLASEHVYMTNVYVGRKGWTPAYGI